jgi:hypothetical protein
MHPDMPENEVPKTDSFETVGATPNPSGKNPSDLGPDLDSFATQTSDRSQTASASNRENPFPGGWQQRPGRFEILRTHAEGGLGVLYAARDRELNRLVALKQIKDNCLIEEVSRNRFIAEAEITGGLEHPGIVPVYSLGSDQNQRPFYAMRLIRGQSLKEAVEGFHKIAARPDPSRPEARQYHAWPVRRDTGRRLEPGRSDGPSR